MALLPPTIVVVTPSAAQVTTLVTPPAPSLTTVVTVQSPGPQGNPGTPGQSGAAGVLFIQAVPSNAWVIPHLLGYAPSVQVLDSTGDIVEADVIATTTTVYVNSSAGPFSGTARLV